MQHYLAGLAETVGSQADFAKQGLCNKTQRMTTIELLGLSISQSFHSTVCVVSRSLRSLVHDLDLVRLCQVRDLKRLFIPRFGPCRREFAPRMLTPRCGSSFSARDETQTAQPQFPPPRIRSPPSPANAHLPILFDRAGTYRFDTSRPPISMSKHGTGPV
jgi:hypothetical protein